jgi:hypothetical protein
MKIKGIPLWEQHIEKLVLALAVLGFGAFAATQFIGNPNAVKKGSEEFSPGNVDGKLQAKAETIQRKLDPGAPSEFEVPQVSGAYSTFDKTLTESISPVSELALLTPVIAPSIGDLGQAVFAYHVPQVPAAHLVRANQYADALAEGVVDQHEQLKERFPALPHDIIWPSIFFKWNAEQMRQELRAGDPNATADGERPIPPKWFDERTTIVDLVVEREELDALSGNWTNLTVLTPIPGQNSLRDRLASEITPRDRQEMLDLLAVPENQAMVIQPEFYATKNGSWAVPSFEEVVQQPVAEDDPTAEQIKSLKRKLSDKQTELQRKETALTNAGGPLKEEDKPKAPKDKEEEEDEEDDGKIKGGGFGFGAGGGAGTGRKSGDEVNRASRLRLTAEVDRLKSDLEKIQKQLEQLGAAIAPVQQVNRAPSDPNADTEIVMWAHDITAVPGTTYRYRGVVQVYNPFYARTSSLIDSQKELAANFVMASPPSEWTEPMEISRPLRHFITRATPPRTDAAAAAMGGIAGQVTAEVFRFYDGRWWTESFTVAAGERVGELVEPRRRPANQEAEQALPTIDYGTDWFVLDVIDDLEGGPDPLGRRSSALVLLQNIKTGEITELIDPDRQRTDPDRTWLRDEVTQAGLQVASAPPPTEGGPPAGQ